MKSDMWQVALSGWDVEPFLWFSSSDSLFMNCWINHLASGNKFRMNPHFRVRECVWYENRSLSHCHFHRLLQTFQEFLQLFLEVWKNLMFASCTYLTVLRTHTECNKYILAQFSHSQKFLCGDIFHWSLPCWTFHWKEIWVIPKWRKFVIYTL